MAILEDDRSLPRALSANHAALPAEDAGHGFRSGPVTSATHFRSGAIGRGVNLRYGPGDGSHESSFRRCAIWLCAGRA